MLTYPVSNMQSPVAAPLIVNLPSLQARWRADQGVLNLSSMPPSDGDGVLSWTDMVGAEDLDKDTFKGSVNLQYETEEQNGHPFLIANGAPYIYRTNSGSTMGNSNAVTLFFVGKAFANNKIVINEQGLSSGIRVTTNSDGKLTFSIPNFGASALTASAGIIDGTRCLLSCRFNHEVGGLLCRHNGIDYPIVGDFSAQAGWGTQEFALGTYPHDAIIYNNLEVGEFLIYTKSLSLSQIEAIEAELNNFWAIY